MKTVIASVLLVAGLSACADVSVRPLATARHDAGGSIVVRPTAAVQDDGLCGTGVTCVFFDTDKAEIDPAQADRLAELGARLKNRPDLPVVVDGHADERGTHAHNDALAEKRAEAVTEALARSGVDPRRIWTRGFGETKPVCAEKDEACWQLNRRGDVIAR